MVYVNVHTLWYLSCVARVSKIIQSKYKNEFDLKKTSCEALCKLIRQTMTSLYEKIKEQLSQWYSINKDFTTFDG